MVLPHVLLHGAWRFATAAQIWTAAELRPTILLTMQACKCLGHILNIREMRLAEFASIVVGFAKLVLNLLFSLEILECPISRRSHANSKSVA